MKFLRLPSSFMVDHRTASSKYPNPSTHFVRPSTQDPHPISQHPISPTFHSLSNHSPDHRSTLLRLRKVLDKEGLWEVRR